MSYQIWIGCTESDAPLIGAGECDRAVVCEHIYPSQMVHRCVARDVDGTMRICTPTHARTFGYRVIAKFPRANGAMGRSRRRA